MNKRKTILCALCLLAASALAGDNISGGAKLAVPAGTNSVSVSVPSKEIGILRGALVYGEGTELNVSTVQVRSVVGAYERPVGSLIVTGASVNAASFTHNVYYENIKFYISGVSTSAQTYRFYYLLED